MLAVVVALLLAATDPVAAPTPATESVAASDTVVVEGDVAAAAPHVTGDVDDLAVVRSDDDVDHLAAEVKTRGADAVYPEILAAIDAGNRALRDALADPQERASTATALLELQRRRTALRLETLPLLSPDVRRPYEGLAPGSFTQLRRETDHVTLAATHLIVVTLPAWWAQWQTPTADRLTSLLLHLGALVALVVATLFIAERGTLLWRRARIAAARSSSRTLGRLGATFGHAMAALWSPLVGLVAVAIAERVVTDLVHFGAVVVALVWLRGWAWLRLLVAIVVEVIHWLAETPLGGLSPATTARVFSSVRFAGRAALVIVVAMTFSEVALGKGALYGLSLRAAWVAAAVVAIVLVRRWQDDIAARYLALRPTGPLADAVRDSQRRFYGFFVGLSALAVVFVQAVSSLVRRFLLGFDQTRKALAFMFRRRLEREAKERPLDDALPLPDSVVAALAEHPDVDELDVIADRHAADMTQLRAAIDHWHTHDGAVGAALLVGLPGNGKTTWVRCALRGVTLPVLHIPFRGRLRSVAALHRTIAAALDLDGETDKLEPIVAALTARRPLVLVVDDLHNLVLRGDPDRRVWDAFDSFVAAVSAHVFVVATIDAFAEEHLRWAGTEASWQRLRFTLRPWSEAEIEALLRRRIDKAGYSVRYDDLVVARVDDADRDLRLLATAREYARLIWDFAEGSPAVALDAWRRSLHLHADGHLHVRLFSQPDEGLLERTDNDARFALAAVLWNENVTAEEAARCLALPTSTVAPRLERLREAGVLVREHQRYRVTTAWWSMVLRFLRRKHLIDD